MLITSTNTINYNAKSSDMIYTRNRQLEHRSNLQNKENTKKLSQCAIYVFFALATILLFCILAGMLYFKSVITEVQIDINNINSEIRIIEQENSRLKAEKISAVNIESIKDSAVKMGMSLPQTYQVEYVDTLGSQENTALNLVD